ncbi:DNA-binding SARP family transcriptional activator [Nocardioides zeae]|uniref:DNA-binding SARP family transcriptional activator n=1 Tax=Nocardioides zeae TaxID=1457234 RepID=A0ACC6IGC6_9ACTN|nr:BTAD domain-containing putative transcriptional regulator [Nocardioides zeae]MDR6172761.1 DNA-binding SARP family transcriptional activator [Nocardioides zeae]MDR6209771.1 DNA-binding SARP family transcriptional activator [Nocardioides zeae]
MSVVRVCLLGDFAVTFGDEPQRVSRAGQRLLALLAVDSPGGRARRAGVAERLWPDLPAGRAASNLRSTLWRLPRPRGRVVVRSDQTSLCLTEDVQVDLAVAHRLAAEVVDDAPAPDLSLLHLDLLPDCDEPWLDPVRESHRQRRLHALERYAQALRQEGRFSEALAAALAAVSGEPLRETAHRQVIAVHLAEGNHGEALRQYDAYRRLLATELGLRPSPAIRDVVAPLLGRPIDR